MDGNSGRVRDMEKCTIKQIAVFWFFLLGVREIASRRPSMKCSYTNFQANCSNLRLTKIPTDILSNTTTLDLSWNKISTLRFNIADMTPNLTKLVVAHCGLGSVDNNTFVELKNLSELYLNGNKLNGLSTGVFGTDLLSLGVLYLNDNQIGRIAQNIFDHLTHLKELHLENNLITYIHPHAFNKLRSLSYLSIEYNQLETADPSWFSPILKSLQHVNLQHNKWMCDSRMIKYKNWTSANHANLRKFSTKMDISCGSKFLKEIHTSELTQRIPTLKAKNFTSGSSVTLSCPDKMSTTWNYKSKLKGLFNQVVSNDKVKRSPGFLTLTVATKTDAGIYCCRHNIGEDLAPAPSQMTNNQYCYVLEANAYVKLPEQKSSSAGAVIIVMLVILAIVGSVVWYVRRKRLRYGLLSDETVFQPTYDESSNITYNATHNSGNDTDEAYV